MFCSKCGNELVEGAKFCNKCGTPVVSIETDGKVEPEVTETKKGISESVEVKEEAALENAEAKEVENKIEEKVPTQSAKTNPKGSTINLNNKMIAAIIAVVAIIIMFAVAIKGCGKKSSSVVDLSDYFTVEFSGVNGSGKADYSFDKVGFDADWTDKLKFKGSDKYPDIDTAYANLVLSDVCGSLYVDPNKKLSNGDVVKLTWNQKDVEYELDELNSVYNRSFIISEKEYTVDGLKETGAQEAGGKTEQVEKKDAVEDTPGYIKTLDGIEESAFDDIKITSDNYISEKTSNEKQSFYLKTYKYDMDRRDYAGRYLFVAKKPENKVQNKLLMIYKKHFNIKTLPKDEVSDIYVKLLKDVDTDFNNYIGVLYSNVTLENGSICYDQNVGVEAVSQKYKHLVEKEVYKDPEVHDLEISVEGYATIDEMLAALKNDYYDDYTIEEKLEEGNNEGIEKVSISDSDEKYVLSGEYDWTYEWMELYDWMDTMDQIGYARESGVGVDFDDFDNLLPEMQEKLVINNINLLRKWGYDDKEIALFKKCFLIERYVYTNEIEENIIDIIDKSFGSEDDFDYFSIILNDNLPMFVVYSKNEDFNLCDFDVVDEVNMNMKINYVENSSKAADYGTNTADEDVNISILQKDSSSMLNVSELSDKDLHLGTYVNAYDSNEKFILYKDSNGDLLADYEHKDGYGMVTSSHLDEHNGKKVPVSVQDKDFYLIGEKGIGDYDKLELRFDGDSMAVCMEYEAVEFTKIK